MGRLSGTDTKALKRWLVRGGYRPGTVRKALTDIRTLLDRPQLAQQPSSPQRARDYRWAFDAYQEWTAQHAGAPVMEAPGAWQGERRNRRKRAPRRTLEVTAIELAAWERVVARVRADSRPQGRALEVMVRTGLRTGDVLRVPYEPLKAAFARDDGLVVVELKGGKDTIATVLPARDAWKALLAIMADGHQHNVAAELAVNGDPAHVAGSPAYKRLVRAWAAHCRAAEVPGRHNLHRIRRTVAVRLRETGASMDDIRDVLGHSSTRVTAGHYLDEYNAGIVAKTLARLEGEFNA